MNISENFPTFLYIKMIWLINWCKHEWINTFWSCLSLKWVTLTSDAWIIFNFMINAPLWVVRLSQSELCIIVCSFSEESDRTVWIEDLWLAGLTGSRPAVWFCFFVCSASSSASIWTHVLCLTLQSICGLCSDSQHMAVCGYRGIKPSRVHREAARRLEAGGWDEPH